MPWTERAVFMTPMDVVSVPEEQMIFHERDAEGNPITDEDPPPEGGEGEDSQAGGLRREHQPEQHPEHQPAWQEGAEVEHHPVYEEDEEGRLRRQEEEERSGREA